MSQNVVSTALIPPPANEEAERREVKITDIKADEFRDAYYLRDLQTISIDNLEQNEREELAIIMDTLIRKAASFSDPQEKLESLQVLTDFSRSKLMNDSLLKKGNELLIQTLREMASEYRKAAEGINDPMGAIDFELRSLYPLLVKEPEHSNIIERRIQEIEEQMKISPVNVVNSAISNLSGRQLPKEITSRPNQIIGELFDLPMENDQYILKTNDGTWLISSFFNIDQELVSVRSKDEPRKSITIPLKELMAALETGNVEQLTEKAERIFQEEKSNQEKLKSYELPSKGGVHLRMFPRSYDSTVSTNLASSMLFSAVLKHRYPQITSLPILFSDDPMTAMERIIQQNYQNGERFFLLDFYNHGSKTSIEFKKKLMSEDLLSITRKYPDAQFQINTVACFGGGLRNGLMQELENEDSRMENVAAFLQAKPHTPNFAGESSSSHLPEDWHDGKAYSTPYYLFLMHSLLEGKSYGEAHVEADWKAKEMIFTDAEAVWNGQLYVDKDRSNERPFFDATLPA